MAGRVAIVLAILCLQDATCDVLKIGCIYSTSGTGLKGLAAVEKWVAWAGTSSNTLNFTVNISYVADSPQNALSATVNRFVNEGMHVIIPPYGSSRTIAAVSAMPSGSNVAILAWGGASDTIFTSNCANLRCFGGFTVASGYISPSLAAIHAKASTNLTVGIIKNANAFSTSVASGATAYVSSTAGLTLSPSSTVSLATQKASLSNADKTEINKVITAAPDVVVVAGHAGDVEEAIMVLRSSSYAPKAIVATNALIDASAYTSLGGLGTKAMENVIMPDQWNEANAADSIVGWTSASFRSALGSNASYHSASAAGLVIALTHAIANGTVGSRMGSISDLMSTLAPVQTFYGLMSWSSNGMIGKPMYGKQRQSGSDVVVAPPQAGTSMVYPMPKVSVTQNTKHTTSGTDATTLSVLVWITSIYLAWFK